MRVVGLGFVEQRAYPHHPAPERLRYRGTSLIRNTPYAGPAACPGLGFEDVGFKGVRLRV